MLQELWKIYIEARPTNNMIERKIRREAFYAGAEAMIEQGYYQAKLESDFEDVGKVEQSLRLVVDNDGE